MKLFDESPLMSAQELADLLSDQFKQPKTRLEPSDIADRQQGGKATSRSNGWKDHPVSS